MLSIAMEKMANYSQLAKMLSNLYSIEKFERFYKVEILKYKPKNTI